jgi:hypothetical protein
MTLTGRRWHGSYVPPVRAAARAPDGAAAFLTHKGVRMHARRLQPAAAILYVLAGLLLSTCGSSNPGGPGGANHPPVVTSFTVVGYRVTGYGAAVPLEGGGERPGWRPRSL